MTETQKTGAFWGVALLMFAIGLYISWPTETRDSQNTPGRVLFGEFKDPLTASDVKVVSFDDESGTLDEFTVRKKSNSDLWTIVSKNDYPADAIEQVTKAAGALIGLKVLDVQTENAEDHADLGVVEPDMTKLKVGDEGVGQLVTFRDSSRNSLAAIIIGNEVKDDPNKRYVRVPGQDPVYVVKFDPAAVSTKFQDWIEDDLLQLSSIEVSKVVLDNYQAQLQNNAVALDKKELITLGQENSQWELIELGEYKPNSFEASPIEVDEDKELDTQRLNDMVNALDDLKFVDVLRKPQGVSAKLKASKELASDNETFISLASRGFLPIGRGDEMDIISANGEMQVTTNDGVKYILRFGESTAASGDDEDDQDEDGLNRYLMVTTEVDESKFPVPDYQSVPQTVEELKQQRREAREAAEKAAAEKAAAENAAAEQSEPKAEGGLDGEPGDSQKPAGDDAATGEQPAMSQQEDAATDDGEKPDDTADPSEASDDTVLEMKDDQPSEPKSDSANTDEPKSEKPKSDETKSDKPAADEPKSDKPKTDEPKSDPPKSGEPKSETTRSDEPAAEASESANDSPESSDPEPVVEEAPANPSGSADATGGGSVEGAGGGQQAETTSDSENQPAPEAPAAAQDADEPSAEQADVDDGVLTEDELTDEEWEELLEAETEKITKANNRLTEARKDSMAAAERRSKELNERFADWFYVIPESTYAKLRIKREDLFKSETSETETTPPGAADFQVPGVDFGGPSN